MDNIDVKKAKLYVVTDKFGHPIRIDLLINDELEFPVTNYNLDINEDEHIILYDNEYALDLDKYIAGGSTDIFYYDLVPIEDVARHNLTKFIK